MAIENEINKLSDLTNFSDFLRQNPIENLTEGQLLLFMRQAISARGDGKSLPFGELAKDEINRRRDQIIVDKNLRISTYAMVATVAAALISFFQLLRH